MRTGAYILALGRRSFEPSDPTNRPDASSSLDSQRALVHAQNDVLATVGVCLNTSLTPPSPSLAENEAGLVVGVLDLTLTYLVTWPLIGIRNRLQVYKQGPETRYVDVLRQAWVHGGGVAGNWAGVPSHLGYQVGMLVREWGLSAVMGRLARSRVFWDQKKRRGKRRWLAKGVDVVLRIGSWAVIYPLFYHSNLQTLQLIGPTPMFPSLRAFIPFSAASPLSPPVIVAGFFTYRTWRSLFLQAITSHFLQSLALQAVSVLIQYRVFRLVSKLLPSPTADEVDDETPLFPITYPSDAEPTPMVATIEIEEVDGESSEQREARLTATFHPETPAAAFPNGEFATDAPQTVNGEEVEDSSLIPLTAPAKQQQNFRSTTLSSHPVDVAATHIADCVSTAVTLVAETAMLRWLAMCVLWQAEVDEKLVEFMVYRPWSLEGYRLVARAVAGEWGVMWALWEGTYVVSTVVGRVWFGYKGRV